MRFPHVPTQPHVHHLHGDEREDPYFWLNQRENPKVREILEQQNAYTESVLAATEGLQESIYQEIRQRMPAQDVSAPVLDNGYWYHYRYAVQAEYPVYYRRANEPGATDEVILDVPAQAGAYEYFEVCGLDISRDNRWLVYACDTHGRRLYRLFIRDLESGQTFATGIVGVAPDPHWSNDANYLFVTHKDPETLRENRVCRYAVSAGVVSSDSVEVYAETDTAFAVELGRSKCWDYLFIVAGSSLSSEYQLLDANAPESEPILFRAREPEHEYYLDYDGDSFFVLSNLGAPNFRLLEVDRPNLAIESWRERVEHRENCYLEDFELTRDHIVVELKEAGQTELEVIDRADESRYRVDFGEAVYAAGLNDNYEYDTTKIRYGFESLATPDSVFDYDLIERKRTLIHRDGVGGSFDPCSYETQRIWVVAKDGARIPVSLVRHRDTLLDGRAPLILYGYGAYGYPIEPGFSYARLSLLDRGFVYAIAHVRGGAELGRAWYDAGRMERKLNSFTDFNDVARGLIERGWIDAARVYASGGSAGGLLVAAASQMAPALYHGVVADVPFVDVLTTMLDESLPLTAGEYDEWGDPNKAADYANMRRYSPYDNVTPGPYPHMLVLAGLHDSQVQYWEPAKWAIRTQVANTAATDVLLYTNLDAGHGGASGRYEPLRETALCYAFLLRAAGIEN